MRLAGSSGIKMADLFDHASDVEALFLQDALEKRKPILHPFGFCHYCASELPKGRLFCDAGCRDDLQNELDAKRRNGT
jgi:hypothetical protein